MNNVTSYFKKKTDFLLSATQPRQYPNVVFPEVAFYWKIQCRKV